MSHANAEWQPIDTIPGAEVWAWIEWRDGYRNICFLDEDCSPSWWRNLDAIQWRYASDVELERFWQSHRG